MSALNFEQIDALLKFIETHTDECDENLNEVVGTDVALLYDILTEMRDECDS